MDLHKRTILKTITWRFAAVIITVLGVYIFNHSWKMSVTAGIIINIIKTILYYIHERIWASVHWQYIKKHETHLRTFVKTFSWKIITVIVTSAVMLFYVNWKIALISGFSINFVKAIFYYGHERIWNSIRYGRKNHNLIPVKQI